MKNFVFILFVATSLIGCNQRKTSYSHKVNPFIGTGGHGHTYPGATAPFGMVQLSPDTRIDGWDACSGYHYSDSTIIGFSHTHLSGTGAADYGDILFTPRINIQDTTNIGFSHENEKAWAGYYSVKLDNNVDVRLTSTTRVGIHEYSFNQAPEGFIGIDLVHGIGPDRLLDSKITVSEENEIAGYRRSSGWAKDQLVYFVAQFSEPFKYDSDLASNTKLTLNFPSLNNSLVVKVGLSSVSIDNARENITKEASGWDFDEFLKQAEGNWNKELSKIKGEFLSLDDETIFYSALYHSLLAPNVYSDVNGEYRGMDSVTYTSTHTHYSVFSLWDTFRAAHPLYTILNQKRDVAMINSMLDIYKQSGLLPVWELSSNETGTMIGYHSIPVIADAIIKKIPGFDTELALEAMQASAMRDHLGLGYYKEMGFVPAEKEHESVSKTLEYAYDDWCIAQAAAVLGNTEVEEEFLERAQYYKNLYDPQTGFMRPKRNSNWMANFDPFEVSGNYTEANAWQYNLFVPHDISNLNKLYGPSTTLVNKLDSLFSATSVISGRDQPDIAGMIGQYAHGNEPSHNFAYLYNYVSKPWKTQEIVHRITTELYSNEPNGLSGNEDCGQMSAWYVFSALGLYPTVPGTTDYSIGTPRVKSASLKLENGNVFKVKANNLSDLNYYIQSAMLNGFELNRSFITHDEIMKGGSLILTMASEPAEMWFDKQIQAPQSKAIGKEITITPIINGGEMTFLDSTLIILSSIEKEAKIYYTVDGAVPTRESSLYILPFIIDTTSVVKARAIIEGSLPSRAVRADFIKIPYGRKIELVNQYSHVYTGNSHMALIDHLRGSANFRDGWQGFYEVDLEAVVDLGQIREVDSVSVGFLQDNYSWIFYPKELIIELSKDGQSFDHMVSIKNLVDPMAEGLTLQSLGAKYDNIQARYVRIKAINIGKCPEWHKGAGNPAWLFTDEVFISTK